MIGQRLPGEIVRVIRVDLKNCYRIPLKKEI
jgi:hypothetical protein